MLSLCFVVSVFVLSMLMCILSLVLAKFSLFMCQSSPSSFDPCLCSFLNMLLRMPWALTMITWFGPINYTSTLHAWILLLLNLTYTLVLGLEFCSAKDSLSPVSHALSLFLCQRMTWCISCSHFSGLHRANMMASSFHQTV